MPSLIELYESHGGPGSNFIHFACLLIYLGLTFPFAMALSFVSFVYVFNNLIRYSDTMVWMIAVIRCSQKKKKKTSKRKNKKKKLEKWNETKRNKRMLLTWFVYVFNACFQCVWLHVICNSRRFTPAKETIFSRPKNQWKKNVSSVTSAQTTVVSIVLACLSFSPLKVLLLFFWSYFCFCLWIFLFGSIHFKRINTVDWQTKMRGIRQQNANKYIGVPLKMCERMPCWRYACDRARQKENTHTHRCVFKKKITDTRTHSQSNTNRNRIKAGFFSYFSFFNLILSAPLYSYATFSFLAQSTAKSFVIY